MNVVIAYLDTMFSAYPQTPRLLEAKAELQGMMEDAYSALIAAGRSENEAVGQVIRDFGNLDEVAPVLGISSDIAPEPAAGVVPASPVTASRQRAVVTLDDARAYADSLRRVRFRFSIAVVMFVLSPAVLIALPMAANAGAVTIADSAAVFVGLLVLFVFVAGGVILLLSASRETAAFTRITDNGFTADPATARWAEALADSHERVRTRALQIAIGLWILAPVPLLSFALFSDGSPQAEVRVGIGVVLVLIFVAAGLGIFLPQNWARTVADEIGSGDSADAGDDERSIVSVIASIYWPLLTAVFLAWSFIGNAWSISWIVWPIGAVLFGAIAAGGSAIESYRRAPRS
ncbi:permease prefix domain 1-containing protein [Agromyces atrinae]|uniref:permease prefix domain 1-containing protein n=1 Tax=Agromyces atrinae TaxID=592376 RepID=UPI001F59CBFE|nr:permease prefix domain 1-containing protein [Agromyces atrinae]MCI2956698.1 permease prefix domain 1-containing protein [Agromyces atrinae]